MRRLLLVDDERALLDGLVKVLRPWRTTWQVTTALGGRAALEALASTPAFDAVVTDARMPEVDGEAVLRAAQERQPTAVRLILSGQVDAKTGHRLAAASHQFLTKPTTAAALMAAVEECCNLAESLESGPARALVASLGQLPLAPAVYHQLTAQMAQPNASIDAVAQLIADDLVLTSSVLRFVNSAFFALPRQLDDVREAVVMLGFERVRELVLLVELFPSPDELGLLDGIRRRGLLRAQLARLLTQGSPLSHLASEAALLSEVGVYALAWKQPARYRQIWREAQAEGGDLEALERAAFGASNAEVAAALLGLWRIPTTVVNAVRWHDVRPSESAGLDARTATALAVALTNEVLVGAPPGQADALAQQVGLSSLLPAARALAARWAQGEDHAAAHAR